MNLDNEQMLVDDDNMDEEPEVLMTKREELIHNIERQMEDEDAKDIEMISNR